MSKTRGRRSTRSSNRPARPSPAEEVQPTIEVKQENGDFESEFCRICLRNPSSLGLQQITAEQKTKLQDTMKLKILRKDSHQYICPNCSNLLDIVVDFKASVLKANQDLFAHGRSLPDDQSEDWFSANTVQVIAQCKTAVEIHRNAIETACKSPEKDEKTEVLEEPEVLLDEPELVEIKVEPFKEPEVVSNGADEEPIEEDGNDDDDDDNDDIDDQDFAPGRPSSSDEEFAAPKRTNPKKRKPRRSKEDPKFKPELCTLCGKRVCGEAAEAHRNQHLGIKPYKCSTPGCNLEFYGPYHKTRHERRMHGESGVLTHKCHICGKMIRGPNGALKYHLSLHGTSEKNFVCTICGKGFTLARYLRQHGMTHSEEFPYACSYCGKRFNNKWSMRTHEKNMHEKRNHAPLATEAERGDDMTGSGTEPEAAPLTMTNVESAWTSSSTGNVELMNISGE